MNSCLQQWSTLCTGVHWSDQDYSDQVFQHLLLDADQTHGMHVDLQRSPLTTATSIPAGNSCDKSSPKDVGPTSACLQKSCRDSGMKSSTDTLVTFSSSHTAAARSGGHVISAPRVFHMFGKPMCTTGPKGQAVLSAQAGPFVSTTRLPGRHRKLHCFGMPRRITQYLQTN